MLPASRDAGAAGANSPYFDPPHPTPLPNGEREQTELAAHLGFQRKVVRHWVHLHDAHFHDTRLHDDHGLWRGDFEGSGSALDASRGAAVTTLTRPGPLTVAWIVRLD